MKPVMAINGDYRRHQPQPDGHRRHTPAEQMIQTLGDQHRIHHVEAGEGEQCADERQNDPAIAELRSGLNHLRQP
jgi:hypothetical protein